MPFCTQCGRPLAEGETCSCRNNSANTTPPPPPQYNSYGYQPYQQGYPQAPYGYGQPYPPYAQQKKSNGWIIGLVIGIVLLFALIGAAIFVPAMLGYTRKAKLSSKRMDARNLAKAADTALVEMDEKGVDLKGVYIISSDENDNVAVSFDTGKFYTSLSRYFPEAEKYKYFIVVRNGTVEYAALADSWTEKTELIGTYPVGIDDKVRLYKKNNSKKYSDEKTNLDSVYWKAYDEIFK
ncbi:hypothetical protein [Ruminococcus sp.]|uniref:hypothetical protein n=1 Tax=Ruminococcus sp. TaxID=41978 RepID=UPI0025D22D4E|nr:hypothetical protein [Ruminococcus sp.]MBQ6252036.1 hypothetical protein [Ruminococcus sp.]